jgi:glycerol-3-phosphate acyltransferase PlsY
MTALYWQYFGLVVLSYLVGSFPTGVVISRRRYGLDVREMGSGNIGATNVTRVFGWGAGVFVFLIDFFKGYLVLGFIVAFSPQNDWLHTACGLALVVGHCFSVYLKGRGGKGVATSLGCLTVVTPWAALAASIAYLLLLLITRISAVGSLGAILTVILYAALSDLSTPLRILIFGISLIVVVRHYSNIKRLLHGIKQRKEKT